MSNMDVFAADAFTMMSMTNAVDKIGFKPQLLGDLGVFDPVPVMTSKIFIEERENEPALIQTSARGAPPTRKGAEQRKVIGVEATRIAAADRISADQVQNIRAFGRESELQMVVNEVNRRQFLLRRDMELTAENMRLGAVQGIVIDADGSTQLFDWPTLLGQTIPTELDFDLDNATPASGALRKNCNKVKRSVLRGLKGLGGNQVSVVLFGKVASFAHSFKPFNSGNLLVLVLRVVCNACYPVTHLVKGEKAGVYGLLDDVHRVFLHRSPAQGADGEQFPEDKPVLACHLLGNSRLPHHVSGLGFHSREHVGDMAGSQDLGCILVVE